jgi:hypothetical protein
MKSGQDRPYLPSQKGLTPRHGATRASHPKNSLNTGGIAAGSSHLSFKITLGGSSSQPLLNTWMDESDTRSGTTKSATTLSLTEKNTEIPDTNPDMRAAGGGAVFFGDRPMWASSSDKKRRQQTYQAGKTLGTPSSFSQSHAVKEAFSRREANPEVLLTPSSSQLGSAAGTARRMNNALFEVTANPNMSRLSAKSNACPMVYCNGQGASGLRLMTLQSSGSCPSLLDPRRSWGDLSSQPSSRPSTRRQ